MPTVNAPTITGPRCARHCHTRTAATTASTVSIPSIMTAATKKWSASLPR